MRCVDPYSEWGKSPVTLTVEGNRDGIPLWLLYPASFLEVTLKPKTWIRKLHSNEWRYFYAKPVSREVLVAVAMGSDAALGVLYSGRCADPLILNDSTKPVFETLLNQRLPSETIPYVINVVPYGDYYWYMPLLVPRGWKCLTYPAMPPALIIDAFDRPRVGDVDSPSGSAHTVAIVVFDSEGRYSMAIVRPMQIAIESTRRVAGWAEPGNLSITLTDAANHLAKHLEIEIGPNKTFDLDLPVATNTSITIETTEKTEASYALTTTIATHHTQTIIEYPPPQTTPRPPPQNQPPNPPPTPKWWVEEIPKPNSTNPIPVTIVIHVVEPNIDPAGYSAQVTALDSDNPLNSINTTLSFTKISDNEAIAKISIPGDHYLIFVAVKYENCYLGLVILTNYLEKGS